MFVPSRSNKYALVGTKDGKIEIIDVESATCVEAVEAHGGSIHSIASIPGGSGFVTGSADHDVKFWEYCSSQKLGEVSPLDALYFLFLLLVFIYPMINYPLINCLELRSYAFSLPCRDLFLLIEWDV